MIHRNIFKNYVNNLLNISEKCFKQLIMPYSNEKSQKMHSTPFLFPLKKLLRDINLILLILKKVLIENVYYPGKYN